jgi:hypothetical protein
MMPGVDLVGGIIEICQFHDVKYGYFASVMGSLSEAVYVIPIPSPGSPLGFKYCEPISAQGPIDLICGQGVICQSEQGETLIHLHAQGVMPDQAVFGGHFAVGGNPVLATIDLVIVEVTEAKFLRRLDPVVGLAMFSPEP